MVWVAVGFVRFFRVSLGVRRHLHRIHRFIDVIDEFVVGWHWGVRVGPVLRAIVAGGGQNHHALFPVCELLLVFLGAIPRAQAQDIATHVSFNAPFRTNEPQTNRMHFYRCHTDMRTDTFI